MKEIVLNENNIKINDYMNRFLQYIDVAENTTQTYAVGLKSFALYLKEHNIKNPTREDIIAYREYLKENHKPNTVNLYLAAVRNFYSWLEYEEITKDITKKVKGIKMAQRHLRRGLSEEELSKVLKCCSTKRETLMIQLMVTCGLRCNEVVNIELNDFYNDKGVVMLRVLGKARDGQKQDSVKVDDRIFEFMKEYIKENNIEDYLFVSTSNHNKNGKLSTATIRRTVKGLFERAELDMEMLVAHSTRHTTCELALDRGMELKAVSEFMRHKSLQTTLVYSKESDARKSTIANQLADIIF